MQIYVITILISLTLTSAFCKENLLVTREYTDFLKAHVSWSVIEYEDNPFKGWTFSDLRESLLQPTTDADNSSVHIESSNKTARNMLPRSIDWLHNKCIYPIHHWGLCSWPYSTVSMLSERCCLSGSDMGFLSIQEILSCEKKSHGCDGGWPAWALEYVHQQRGLVTEKCFPWLRMPIPCPRKCFNGESWKKAHVCDCVGGFKTMHNVEAIMEGLQTGPVVATIGICRSFMAYRGGVYHCNCGGEYVGVLPTELVGYGHSPECYFHGKGPWGTLWGEKGYFKVGCKECGIDGKYPNGNVYCPRVSKDREGK